MSWKCTEEARQCWYVHDAGGLRAGSSNDAIITALSASASGKSARTDWFVHNCIRGMKRGEMNGWLGEVVTVGAVQHLRRKQAGTGWKTGRC